MAVDFVSVRAHIYAYYAVVRSTVLRGVQHRLRRLVALFIWSPDAL
jgi:hypothetical protein